VRATYGDIGTEIKMCQHCWRQLLLFERESGKMLGGRILEEDTVVVGVESEGVRDNIVEVLVSEGVRRLRRRKKKSRKIRSGTDLCFNFLVQDDCIINLAMDTKLHLLIKVNLTFQKLAFVKILHSSKGK